MPDESIWDDGEPETPDEEPLEPVTLEEATKAARPVQFPKQAPGPNDAVEAAQTDEEREQAIRDRYGYTASETRTERERSDAGARMLGRDPDEYWKSRH